MKFFIFISFLVFQSAFAQEAFNFQRDLPLILKAQEALKSSDCEMKLDLYKNNILLQLRSQKKFDASNFHHVITTKEEILKHEKRTTIFTTTWFQNVLFSHKKFVTNLMITEEDDRVTSLKMKTRESGATIYYPILRSSTVRCVVNE